MIKSYNDYLREISEHISKLTAERDALKVDCRNKDFAINELNSELDLMDAKFLKLRQAADIVQADYFDWYDAEHDHELETDVALHSRMEKLRDAVKAAE